MDLHAFSSTVPSGASYVRWRSNTAPTHRIVGISGDVYLDTKAMSLYGKNNEVWIQWPGPKLDRAVLHPSDPDLVLWCTLSPSAVGWLPRHTLLESSDSPESIIRQFLETEDTQPPQKRRRLDPDDYDVPADDNITPVDYGVRDKITPATLFMAFAALAIPSSDWSDTDLDDQSDQSDEHLTRVMEKLQADVGEWGDAIRSCRQRIKWVQQIRQQMIQFQQSTNMHEIPDTIQEPSDLNDDVETHHQMSKMIETDSNHPITGAQPKAERCGDGLAPSKPALDSANQVSHSSTSSSQTADKIMNFRLPQGILEDKETIVFLKRTCDICMNSFLFHPYATCTIHDVCRVRREDKRSILDCPACRKAFK